MSNFNKYFYGIFAASFLAVSAIAQEVEEVVVTATKKSESIQDLALSIEAFTGDQVDENMIADMDDLAEVVPGLITAKGIGSGVSYAIRGTGSYGVGAAVVGAVVTAYNGHAVGASSLADVGLYDVERVEVLKGPQGTLFGRNAVAGVINVISARPEAEFSGSVDLDIGDHNSSRLTSVVNMPITDSIRTRLAVTSYSRDGFSTNTVTNEKFDDRDAIGMRLSADWDIDGDSVLKLTYEKYEGEDNRNNIGTAFCASDPLLGCDPTRVGGPNVVASPAGSTAGLSNVVYGLVPSSLINTYADSIFEETFDKAQLNRIPEHNQIVEVALLEYVRDLGNGLTMNAKYSYNTRDYNHMNDNDYGYTETPFPGVLAPLATAEDTPAALAQLVGGVAQAGISWEACFLTFCEMVNSDRTYEFSSAEDDISQAEISIISDFDGPFNFVVGYYNYDARSHNKYSVQTAAANMAKSFANHPYNALFGGAYDAYGGTPFYQTLVIGAGGIDACENELLPVNITAAPSSLNPDCFAFAIANLLPVSDTVRAPLPPYHLPVEHGGYYNDDHVRTKSKALFGEMYFDLSDVTKLTLGVRYNDDVVKDSIMTCLWDVQCPNLSIPERAQNKYIFDPTVEIITDDALAYKVALQHDLSDDQMVYASYTTAVKAGGNNPVIGTEADPYDQEEVGVFELGTKAIFMDGAVLLNAAVFMNDTKGMLISNIENAGSRNYNIDAEIKGFEGNLVAFLSESTRLEFNWLLVDSELGDQALQNAINTHNIVQRLAIDPTGYTPGVAGCGDTGPICNPAITAAGPVYGAAGVAFPLALSADAAGLMNYGYGLDAEGNVVFIAKSFGFMCTGYLTDIATILNPAEDEEGNALGFNPLGGGACPVDPLLIDVGGNSLPQSPETSYSLALNQAFETQNGIVDARLVYRYMSEREGNVHNTARGKMPEHKFWDFNMKYTPNNGSWYVGLYAKNLANDRFLGTWANSSALQGGAQFGTYTDPRTFGLTFGTDF